MKACSTHLHTRSSRSRKEQTLFTRKKRVLKLLNSPWLPQLPATHSDSPPRVSQGHVICLLLEVCQRSVEKCVDVFQLHLSIMHTMLKLDGVVDGSDILEDHSRNDHLLTI